MASLVLQKTIISYSFFTPSWWSFYLFHWEHIFQRDLPTPLCFVVPSQPYSGHWISLFHPSHQNTNMISCLSPLKILSRSFQLHCISQLHCLVKPFWRAVCFVPISSFPILTWKNTQALPPSLHWGYHPPRSSWTSTWPSSLSFPSPPLTWLGSCMGHSWFLLSSWKFPFNFGDIIISSLATPAHCFLLVGSPPLPSPQISECPKVHAYVSFLSICSLL